MDMENICVIEIECFGFNAEIIKELAFCNKYFNGAVAFSPSLLHQVTQTETDRRHNAFITRHLHGIPWEERGCDYAELNTIIKNYFASPNITFYSKGLQKCQFLQNTLGLPNVQNLEDLGCPKITLLAQRTQKQASSSQQRPTKSGANAEKKDKKAPLFNCHAYPRLHKFNLNCAHRKAVTFHHWLEKLSLSKPDDHSPCLVN